MTGAILVTGGAGYIGSHTALALIARGRKVVVLDDLSTGARDIVPTGVPLIVGSVADEELVRHVLVEHGCTAVIHFAGSIINPESFETPLEYYQNNVCASRNLLAACAAENVQNFLFSSSAAVYGECRRLPIGEEDPTDPISPYGTTKLITEWMVRDLARANGMNWAALRYFNVAGADPALRSGQVGPATHLIKIAAEAAIGVRPGLTIFGDDYDTPDGTCIRDYIHVSDLADAHVTALEHLERGGDSFVANCGYGRGFSVREVIAAIESVIGRSLMVEVGARRVGDATALVADGRRLVNLLGWKPRFDHLPTIIETALSWEAKRAEAGAGRG